jgi:hypothetical protein
VLGDEPRLSDVGAVEALEPFPQHRSVFLISEAWSDVDQTLRVDTEQVAVVGEMVDGAQRQPVPG